MLGFLFGWNSTEEENHTSPCGYDDVDRVLEEADQTDYATLFKAKGISWDLTVYEEEYNPSDPHWTENISGIPVYGTEHFINLARKAIDTLKTRAPEDWQFIKRLVGSIDLVPDDGSGALGRIYHGCSVVEFLPAILDRSHITLAQKIAHEAYHLAGNYGEEGERGAHRYESSVAAKIGGSGYSESDIDSRIDEYKSLGRWQ